MELDGWCLAGAELPLVVEDAVAAIEGSAWRKCLTKSSMSSPCIPRVSRQQI